MSNSESEINLKHIGNCAPQPRYLCSKFFIMIRILVLLVIIAIIACNNAANNNTAPKTKTQTDSLMDEVMEGHNVAMAKVSRLHKTNNQIHQVLDSISKLSASAQNKLGHYKTLLDSASNRLTSADAAMEKWMSEFNIDSASNDADKRVKYLESEKTKILNVRDVIVRSLQMADSFLKRPK
jgi:TolA-binding protein